LRDLLVFAVVMLTLPAAFRRPFIGLLLFSWLAYMRPQDLCWSFARTMRFSFFVGLVMLVGWAVHEAGHRKFWRPDVRTVSMLILGILMSVGLIFARNTGAYVMQYYVEFVKILMVALFTTGQVDSRQRLRVLLWTICLCLGFYGIKGGVFGVMTGGSTILRGPGGMLLDNNDFALALVMNVPLLFYLGRSEKHPVLRRAADVGVMLTVLTILLTHSRGGFLALAMVTLVIAWRAQRLLQAGGMLILLAAAFFLFVPEHVMARLATIFEGGEESSAGARLHSWGVALRMIGDFPLLGVGLRNFQVWYRDYSEFTFEGQFAYVAHNSYLQIWAEGGTIAFVVYLVLLLSVFPACRKLRHYAKGRPDLEWAGQYGRMMEATMVGFMTGAVFLNRGHFDLVYHFLALVSCMLFVTRLAARQGPVVAREGSRMGEVIVRLRPVTAGPSMLPRWGR
jgi:probable O-glycosylation ligase (exosortase A-associated)